jgi:phosphoesterase RecJ-like protein
MFKQIDQAIQKHDSIVISRHKAPDYDAYGAQFGLFYALKESFPRKNIYVIGDTNSLNRFRDFDNIDQTILNQSLMIIVDTAVEQMLFDQSYRYAKTLMVIDHHQNDSDLNPAVYYKDTEASSASELIARIIFTNRYPLPQLAAKALFMGIVGDTGRFLFSSVKPETFQIAAKLLATGIDLNEIYNSMYVESLQAKKMKADYLTAVIISSHGVGYRIIGSDFLAKHQIDSYTASRSLANQLSGIKEVPIWANFTHDTTSGRILCELRSREIPIVDVAKKYGGGGHLNACGCTIEKEDVVQDIVKDLDYLAEVHHGQTTHSR